MYSGVVQDKSSGRQGLHELQESDGIHCSFVQLPLDHAVDADTQQKTVSFATDARSRDDSPAAPLTPSVFSDVVPEERCLVQDHDLGVQIGRHLLQELVCAPLIHFRKSLATFFERELVFSGILLNVRFETVHTGAAMRAAFIRV